MGPVRLSTPKTPVPLYAYRSVPANPGEKRTLPIPDSQTSRISILARGYGTTVPKRLFPSPEVIEERFLPCYSIFLSLDSSRDGSSLWSRLEFLPSKESPSKFPLLCTFSTFFRVLPRSLELPAHRGEACPESPLLRHLAIPWPR